MKKHFLLFTVLIGLAPSTFCLEAQQEQKPNAKTVGWRSKAKRWQTAFKDKAAYEKDVWAKGLPAARKKLWYKKPLTKKEQLYFNALKKRVGGIAAIITLLYGRYKGKKIINQRELEKETRREEELIEKKRFERELEAQIFLLIAIIAIAY